MMSETVLQTAVCNACGSDVRDESLFCYNCGERVREDSTGDEPKLEQHIITAQPGSRPPLRSAASLRKERRAFNRQPVEVSWERPSNPPVGFVITTIILAIGALVLLLLALYLR